MTTHRDDDFDTRLDRVLDEIRNEQPDPARLRAATDRVWNQVSGHVQSKESVIRDCSDFQALLPNYISGSLEGPRAALVKDHLGECVACRRSFRALRAPGSVSRPATTRAKKTRSFASFGWRTAAAAAVILAVVGFSFNTRVLSLESGGIVRIEAVDGEIFHVTDDGSVPLVQGQTVRLGKGETVRTTKGANAMLRLEDDSRVEVGERSELAVLERRYLLPGKRSDGVIALDRGGIIVEASKQGSGHLYVDTDDCEVAVTGTVFSVNHGMKGSRVSVIEGNVEVSYGGHDDVLSAGDQTTTRAMLHRVPIADEISWSRNRTQYLALMKEMQALDREIEQALRPGSRYDTGLIDLAPADTTIYVGVPNISGQLQDAYEILEQRMATSDLLRQYWDEHLFDSVEIEEILNKIRSYGDHLGDEVAVLVGGSNDAGKEGHPLILARVSGADSLAAMITDDIAEIAAESDGKVDAMVIRGDLAVPSVSDGDELIFWVRDDLVAMSTDYGRLLALDAVLQGFRGASLDGGSFHEELSARYDDGVEWLVGVDISRLIDRSDTDALDSLGLTDVQHLIVERESIDDATRQAATLTFDGPRERLAGWLAEPAPIGALDYVGPDATLAAAFAMKDVGVVVDELFGFLEKVDENFDEGLAEFQAEQGVDIRRDFADPLGGEFVLALDGPMLPEPAWKLVMECYDPSRLESSLEWVVEQVNTAAHEAGRQGVELVTENLAGRTYLRLVSLDVGLDAWLTFDDGYLVVAPSRALVDRAVEFRASGVGLASSPDFVERLPSDNRVHFSGMLYHNLGSTLAPIARMMGGGSDLNSDELAIVSALASDAGSGLALLYGETDRIDFVSEGEGGILGSTLHSLTGFGGLLDVPQSVGHAARHDAGGV